MLFNSPLYGAFLLATFVVFWLIRRYRLPRVLFLILASYGFYFYGTWDTAKAQEVPLGPFGWSVLCLGVIFVGSSLDFWIGRALGRIENRHARRALLLVSIFYYLGVLSVFKYWNFAADTFADVARALGGHVSPTHLRLVLPFGISFFTFETMSYTIDVYRRELPPADRYLDYLLFVCFFPHLVAGPIVRPKAMLPQFRPVPTADTEMQGQGLWLIATGLAKKIVVGDYLALAMVGRVFDNPERFSALECLFAVYAYAIQIYADFSGYTDVALGSSLLFGYRLPLNFDAPYTAKNLQDFWHRWHISLSSWLRDYLYIPLGGSKKGPIRTYVNLMITMLLGGLWHGASWNFVIWGALHGGALAGTRAWQRARGGERQGSLAARVLCVVLTFHFVCFAWVFFRAKTFAHATLMLERIGTLSVSTTNLPAKVVGIVLLGMILHFLPKGWTARARDAFVRTPAVVQGLVLAAAAVGIHLAAGAKPEPFVYGQF
jgi:D-alanyl-lipoteichoic acid acyltransferase DltB (MBOAT superfamily)